ncbi:MULTISPECIES: S8 family serine peptidase [unclassified Paraburkholderia]|uniref:S8 family serine peptidase n=1 Tax=unclassified Paraburkholderia TaxID=2615204 RepID=UPI001615A1D6|nr:MULTISPECIES: S8 family serine peptidase [unclassified Paraburkholderia]MBB5446634.1 serine protease [Paraburkholderia sp. WSM4177]MBB5487179.1 serine protease [Paraburkholderia sp. WSM4180]
MLSKFINACRVASAAIFCTFVIPVPTALAGPAWPASATIPVNLGGNVAGQYTDAAGNVFDGTGYTVVDIDGAFRPDNPAFQSSAGKAKIISEACFGATAGAIFPDLCDLPTSTVSSSLSGSPVSYYFSSLQKSSYPSDSPFSSCRQTDMATNQLALCHYFHGTATAGVIVGQQTSRWEGSTQFFYTGAAPGANVIAIKVGGGAGIDASNTTGWPIDSIVNALWYVNGALLPRPDLGRIVAVNISANGMSAAGDFPCDANSDGARIDAVAAVLRSKGVAVVMAAGNDAVNGTGTWTCGNNVIAVGATGIVNPATPTTDTNISPRVALFAPVGSANRNTYDYVLAPWQGLGSFYVEGTSFAAPQVAAAFAVLHQKFGPNVSVTSLLDLLQRTGTKLTGTRSGQASPNASVLNIRAALNGTP